MNFRRVGWIFAWAALLAGAATVEAGILGFSYGWGRVCGPVVNPSKNTVILTGRVDNRGGIRLTLNLVQVSLLGAVNPSDVARVYLYRDDVGDGFTPSQDFSLASATVGADRTVTFGGQEANLDLINASETLQYFLTVSLKSTASQGRTLGLRVLSLATDYGVVLGNGTVGFGDVKGPSFEAAVDQVVGAPTDEVGLGFRTEDFTVGGSNPVIDQGAGAEMWQFFAGWQNAATWNSLRVSYTGTNVNDVAFIKFYKQLPDPSQYYDRLDPITIDVLIASGTFGTDRQVTLDCGNQVSLVGSRSRYLITLTLKSSAVQGNTIGLSIPSVSWVGFTAGNGVADLPQASRTYAVSTNPPNFNIYPSQKVADAVLEAGALKPLLKITLFNRSFLSATLYLSLLQVSLTGPAQPSDVAKVYLFKDKGDGTFGAEDVTFFSVGVFHPFAQATFGANRLASLGSFTQSFDTLAWGQSASYFLAVSLAPSASMGRRLGVDCLTLYFTPGQNSYNQGQYNLLGPPVFATTGVDQVIGSSGQNAAFAVEGDPASVGPPNATMVIPGRETEYFYVFVGARGSADWSGLRLSYAGTDLADVESVTVYRQDSGALQNYQRWDLYDFPLVSATFGTNRQATLDFGETERFAIGARLKYLVTLSLKPSAIAGHLVKLSFPGTSWLNVASGGAVSNAPQTSRMYSVSPPGMLTMTAEVVAPPGLTQGLGVAPDPEEGGRAAFLRLTLKTDQGEVEWQSLKVSLLGTATARNRSGLPATISRMSAYLYRDANGDGTWDASDLSLKKHIFTSGTDYGTLVGSDRAVTFSGLGEIIGPSPRVYFLVAGVQWVVTGKTIGFTLRAATDVGLANADAVSTATFPMGSGIRTTIVDRPDELGVDFQTTSFSQGWFPGVERPLAIVRFLLPFSGGGWENAAVNSLRLSLSGNFPMTGLGGVGLQAVRLYEDRSPYGVLDSGDLSLTGVTMFNASRMATLSGFNSTNEFYADYNPRLMVTVQSKSNVDSQVGKTLGVGEIRPQDIGILAPDTLAATLAPVPAITMQALTYCTLSIASMAPVQLTQGVETLFIQMTLAPQPFSSVVVWQNLGLSLIGDEFVFYPNVYTPKTEAFLYKDANGNGTWDALDTPLGSATGNSVLRSWGDFILTGAMAQTLTQPKTYFVTIRTQPNAVIGTPIVLSIRSDVNFTFSSPGVKMYMGGGIAQADGGSIPPPLPFGTTVSTVVKSSVRLTFFPYSAVGSGLTQYGFLRLGTDQPLLNIGVPLPQIPAVWDRLAVSMSGDAPPSMVSLQLKNAANTPLGGATPDPTTGVAIFSDLNVTLQAGGGNLFVVSVTLASNQGDALLGRTVMLTTVMAPLGLSLLPPDEGVMGTGFPTAPVLLTVIAENADLVAFPAVDSVDAIIVGSPGITPYLRLTPRVIDAGPDGQATWTALFLTLADTPSGGEAVNPLAVGVRLYRDMDSNGLWEEANDSLVAGDSPSNFTAGKTRSLSGFSETLVIAPQVFFVVLTLKAGAVNGTRLAAIMTGVSLANSDLVLSLGTGLEPLEMIVDTPDVLHVGVVATAPPTLTQGRGDTFLRLSLAVEAPEYVRVNRIQLSLTGNLDPALISSYWVRDANSNQQYDDFDEENGIREWPWTIGDQLMPSPQLYFLRLSLSALAPEGATVGVTLVQSQDVEVEAPDVAEYTGQTVAPGKAAIVTVIDEPDALLLNKDLVNGVTSYSDAPVNGLVRQGVPVSLMRMYVNIFPTNDRVTIAQMRVSLNGNYAPSDLTSLQLYQDADNSRTWTPGDQSLGSTVNFSNGMATIALNATLMTGNRLYLVLTPSPGVQPGLYVSLRIPFDDTLPPAQQPVLLAGSDTLNGQHLVNSQFYHVSSASVTFVVSNADFVGGAATSILNSSSLIRHSLTSVLRFSLATDRFDARVTSVALSLTLTGGTASATAITAYLYRDVPPTFSWSPEVDPLVAMTVFNGDGHATFSGFSEIVGVNGPGYYVALKFGAGPPAGATLRVGGGSTLTTWTVTPPDRLVAWPYFLTHEITLAEPPPPLPSVVVGIMPRTPAANLTQVIGIDNFVSLTLRTTAGVNTWSTLTFSLSGDLDPNDVDVGLYAQAGGGLVGFYDYSIIGRRISLGGFFPSVAVDATPRTYHLKLTPRATAPPGKTVGVVITGVGAVEIEEASTHTVSGGSTGFPVTSPSATVQKLTATLVSAWSMVDDPPRLLQVGGPRVWSRLSITVLSGGFPITLSAVKVSLGGSVAPRWMKAHLFQDTNGDGLWQAFDASLTSATFDQDRVGTFTGLGVAVTSYYPPKLFVALEADPLTPPEETVSVWPSGAAIGGVAFAPPDQEVASGSTALPGLTLSMAAANTDEVTGGFLDLTPTYFLGGRSDVLFRLSLAVRRGDGTAQVAALAVSLKSIPDPSWVTLELYRDNGNGTWEEDKDQSLQAISVFTPDRWATFAGIPLDSANMLFVRAAIGAQAPDATLGAWMPQAGISLDAPDRWYGGSEGTTASRLVYATFNPVSVTLMAGLTATSLLVQGQKKDLLNLTFRPALGSLPSIRMTQIQLSLIGDASPGQGVWELSIAGLQGIVTGSINEDRRVTFQTAVMLPNAGLTCLVWFRPSSNLPPGTLIGVSLVPTAGAVVVDFPGTVVGFIGVGTSLFAVQDGPDQVGATVVNLAPTLFMAGSKEAFLRLTLTTGSDDATLTAIRVKLIGTLNPTLTGIQIYKEATGDGTWSVQDTLLGQTLGSGGIDGEMVTLTGPAERLTASPGPGYYVVLSLSPSPTAGTTVGAEISGNPFFALPPDSSANVVTFRSSLAAVRTDGVAAEGLNLVTTGTVVSGALQPLYRLSFNRGPMAGATLQAIQVEYNGSVPPEWMTLYLYRDRSDQRNGLWETTDERVGTLAGRASFDYLNRGSFTLLGDSIAASGHRCYYVAVTLAPSTPEGGTVGVSLRSNWWTVETVLPIDPFVGGLPLVRVDSPDQLMVTATGGTIPSHLAQGQSVTVMYLTLASNQDTTQWKSIRLSLAGDLPSDHARVQITGDGFSSALLTFQANRMVTVTLEDSPIITPIPIVVAVLLVLQPWAQIDRTAGVVLTGVGALTAVWPDTVSLTPSSVATGLLTVADAPDVVEVSAQDVAPVYFSAQHPTAFLRVSVKLSGDAAEWRGIRLASTGTIPSTLVVAQLYRGGALQDGVWDGSGASLDGRGFGSDGFVTLGGFTESVNTLGTSYLIVLTHKDGIAPGMRTGVKIPGSLAVSLTSPDVVNAFADLSSGEAIIEAADVVAIEGLHLAPPVMLSGTLAPLLRLSFQITTPGRSRWTALRVSLTGELPAEGLTLRLFQDAGNGIWDGDERWVRSAAFGLDRWATLTSLSETLFHAPCYFLVMAHGGNVMHQSFGLTLLEAGWIFEAPDGVEPGTALGTSLVWIKQPAQALARFEGLGPLELIQGSPRVAAFRLTLATDQDWAFWTRAVVGVSPPAPIKLELYQDTNPADGVWATEDRTLASGTGANGVVALEGFVETLTSSPSRYFLVVAPETTAPIGNFQLSIWTGGWGVQVPDTWASSGISTSLSIQDVGDLLRVTVDQAGPPTHPQRAERAYLKLTLSVDQDEVIVTTLQVRTSGTVPLSARGPVGWYFDQNDDGTWDSTDRLLGSATIGETGVAVIGPLVLTVQGPPLTTFLAARLLASAPEQGTAGLELPDGALAVRGADTVAVSGATQSVLKTVTPNIPLTLVVGSQDLESIVAQGGSTPVLRITFDNGTSVGDASTLQQLTVHVAPADDVESVRIEREGVTVTGVGDGPVRVLFPPETWGFSGSTVWTLIASVNARASLQDIGVTLVGASAAFPDTVLLTGVAHVGRSAVSDLPDTMTMVGVEGRASLVELGSEPAPLWEVTLRVTSLPEDRVALQTVTVALQGASPPGVTDPRFHEHFEWGLYRSIGGGPLALAQSTLVASGTFPDSRLAVLPFSEIVNGAEVTRWHVALSLKASTPLAWVYGATVGLSFAGAVAAYPDGVVMSGVTGVSLRRVLDRLIHVQTGGIAPATPLTLGMKQVVLGWIASSDRDQAILGGLVLSHRIAVNDEDWSRVELYRESNGDGRFSPSEDESLTSGTLIGGQVSLGAEAGTVITSSSSTLWVVATVHPFASTSGLVAPVVRPVWRNEVISGEEVALEARALVDGPSLLWLGASDLSSPVVITGESVLVIRLSLRAPEGEVGIRRMGVRLVSTSAQEFESQVWLTLREGDRTLASARLAGSSPIQLNLTFGLRETVSDVPRVWDVHLAGAPTAPPHQFRLLLEASDLVVVGPSDTVTGNALTSSTMQIISQWGFATIRMGESRALAPAGGVTVNRGDAVPLGFFDLATVEPLGVARLTALRLTRTGRGLPTDVRLAVYASRSEVESFDSLRVVRVGEGGFGGQTVVVTLVNKPFLTNLPKRFWLVGEVRPGALVGAKWGVELGSTGLLGQGTFDVDGGRFPFRTPLMTIGQLLPSTVSVSLESSPTTKIVQGAQGVVVGTLTARLTDGSGSVWTGVHVSLASGESLVKRLIVFNAAGEPVTRGQRREGAAVWITLGEPVSTVPSIYRLVVEVWPQAATGLTLQISVPDGGLSGPPADTVVLNGGSGWMSNPLVIQDAPDTLTLVARPRPVPWEVGEWTPAFLITLMVNQDEASLIRITISTLGNWVTGELGNFRMRIGDTIVPIVAQSLGGGWVQLSLVNYPVTRLSSYPVGALELSLSPTVSLTGTLGLSLLGVGVAPDPVTGNVGDIAIFTPVGTSLLGIRNPHQPFPPALVVNARYVKGIGAFGATWGATVKQGAISNYRYMVLSWKGVNLDFAALTESLASDPLSLSPEWDALIPWTVTEVPRLLEPTLQLTQGLTLYVAVQAKTSDGPWSEVTYSDPVVVDGQKPQFSARSPEVLRGKKQMILSWAPPTMGPSGVERYIVERRKGTKPRWEVVTQATAPRLLSSEGRTAHEGWEIWYPASSSYLLTGKSGNWLIDKPSNSPVNQLSSYPVGQAPALVQSGLLARVEAKLQPYLSSTSAALPLEDGTSYYRVKAVSGAGEESEPTATTKVVSGLEGLAQVISDVSNYPNPFDSRKESSMLVYVLNQDAPVTIRIYTVLGELVREWQFDQGTAGGQAGANEVVWDGANGAGAPVITGAYICLIKADVTGQSATVVRKIGVKH